MVAVQLDCTIDEALNRLIIRAAASGRSLERVALDVLDRVLRFDP
jgi:plasmid stability protein